MVSHVVTTEELGFTIFDQDVIARPHRFYEAMRREAPILWCEEMGGWLLSRHEDVKTVLRDEQRFSSVRTRSNRPNPQLDREQVAPRDALTMLGSDPPDHTRLRRLLDRDFTPKMIYAMEPFVQSVADELLDGAAGRDEFDVMEGLAIALPVIVIAELLGVPRERRDDFKRWSTAVTEPFTPSTTPEEAAERDAEIVEFRDFLNTEIASRHEHPTDDFIGRLVAAHDDEEKLTDGELLAAVSLLLVAGNETTTNLIGNGVFQLLHHPEQLVMLRDDPALIEGAIEEFLRFDGSVQHTSRVVMETVEFHGQEVEQGAVVLPILASANRDERVYERSEQFDITRTGTRHVGLGDWIHICLGQYLARLETNVAVTTLLKEFPNLEPAAALDELRYRPQFNLRGLVQLPVRNGARG